MIILVLWVGLSFLAASIADNKGNCWTCFFISSLIVSPVIGIIWALCEGPNQKNIDNRKLRLKQAKRCKSCSELIRYQAKICRFCKTESVD